MACNESEKTVSMAMIAIPLDNATFLKTIVMVANPSIEITHQYPDTQ